MTTATAHKIRADLAVFSSRELAGVPDSDLRQGGPLFKTDPQKWEAALAYRDDPEFRAALVHHEVEAATPKPAPAPPPAASTSPRLSRGELSPILRAVGRFIRKSISEHVGGLASASRVLEIETSLREQVVALQERCARDEKRIATVEQRFNEQSRHLRNLEARIRGEGAIEHAFRAEKGDE